MATKKPAQKAAKTKVSQETVAAVRRALKTERNAHEAELQTVHCAAEQAVAILEHRLDAEQQQTRGLANVLATTMAVMLGGKVQKMRDAISRRLGRAESHIETVSIDRALHEAIMRVGIQFSGKMPS